MVFPDAMLPPTPSTITLLLIEDFAMDREAYKRYLQADQAASYVVLEAETLEEGLDLWQVHQPDVILLDMNLPDGDGLDLLDEMAEAASYSQLPVVVLTGQGDERTAVRAMKLGAVDYLVKGDITAAVLIEYVHQTLRRTAIRRQFARSQRQTALVAEMALRVRQSLDLQTILNVTVEEMQGFLDVDRALVYQFDPVDMSGTVVAETVVAPWSASRHHCLRDTCFQDTKGTAYRQGRIFMAEDIYEAGLSDCHLQLLEQYQVKANVAVPILLPQATTEATLWGLLVVHQCRGPRQWEASDVQLLEQLAVQVAIAIQQAELVNALQRANTTLVQLNTTLEEQVRARTAELKESRNRFRAIFNGMFQFTGLLTPEGMVLEANNTALEAGGLRRDSVIGRPFWEASWWKTSPQTQAQLRQAIAQAAQGQFVRYEVDVLMAGPSVVTIDFSLRPVRDEQGQIVLLIPEGRDLTEAKQLRTEREEAFQRLQDSERLYASLAAAAPVGIFRMDGTGNCSYVNERYCELTGLTADLARGYGWQPWVHPEDRDRAIAQWQRCVRENCPCQLECRFVRPDQSIAWFYIQTVAHRDHTGQVVDYIGTLMDISDRKRAEEDLRASERANRAILTAIPDLMVRVTNDGSYRGFVAERRQLDVIPQTLDAIGKRMIEVLPPPLAERKMYYLGKALETNEVQIFEQEVAIDGRIQHEEVRVVRSSDDEVLFIIRDIGERKRAEAERLKAAQVQKELQLLENVLDIIRAGYWDWNIPAGTEYLSTSFQRLFGYEADAPPDRPQSWQHLLFPEDAPRVLEQFERHVQSQGIEPFQDEVRCRHKDGSTVWVMYAGRVIEWDAAGHPIRMIGCHLDITQRARLEAEQERAKAQIENQLVAIESAIDGIGILENERYIYANQSHRELFGFQHMEDLIGESWQKLYAPEQLDKFKKEIFPQLFKDRYWQGETLARRQDGTFFPQELSLTLTQSDLLICVCRDVSDRKATEAQLRRTNQELERATRLKDEFLATMSHELRTPLNAILGMSQGLDEQVLGPLTQRQLKAVKTINRSGEHLLELINDILDLSKIESGHTELDIVRVDVAHLCRSSLAFIKQQAHKKHLRLHINLPENIPIIQVDERRIRQVLINLLINAVKFTPEGGSITLAVTTDPPPSAEQNASITISVTDTGIGIAAEHLPQLFEPFVQVDSSLNRKYEGTGLGLSLVKRLTELHGGEVSVTSQLGKGSCFSVTLPCGPMAQVASTPSQAISQAGTGAAEVMDETAAETNPSLILLVEDNESNIFVVQSYLEVLGFEMQVAQTGQEALNLVQRQTPDLILMDIQMPEMDGLTATRILRQDPEFQTVPIIALTALAMPGDREECLAAGANDYVSKPIQMRVLVEKIYYWLSHHDC
jgi:PAS domain S-box-containing protein